MSGRLLEARVSSTVARRVSSSPGRIGTSQRTSSTPGAPIELELSTKPSAHIRIRMQQAYQPEAHKPAQHGGARRRLVEMHRLGIEFGGERHHLVARHAAAGRARTRGPA